MSDVKALKAIKSTISDYETIEPRELVVRLRDLKLAQKLQKQGMSEAQIHRLILYVTEHKPGPKELVAFLKSKLV